MSGKDILDISYATDGDIEIIGKKSGVQKTVRNIENAKSKKEIAISNYRKEASRLASKANKRIERLERNNFKDTPAYQAYLRNGGKKFSVRGKTFNEVQAEVSKLNAFLEAKTSTVRGAREVLRNTADLTGMKYGSLKELQSKAGTFFELASKIEQYLRLVEDSASAIGYQKIWEQINQYTKEQRIDLTSNQIDVNEMVERVSKAILDYEDRQGFTVDRDAIASRNWFILKDDE